MVNQSIIGETALRCPVAAASTLSPKSQNSKKTLVVGVMLTSLVDAFSILVIYLLVSFSNSGEVLYLSKDMELPVAAKSEVLKRTTVVKLESGKLYIEDKEVDPKSLLAALMDTHKDLKAQHKGPEEFNPALTVQADRRVSYKELNPIVHASAQSGFSEVRFAVLAK